VLRAALVREAGERRRAECRASMQTEIVQLALDLLVREPDIDGFFGAPDGSLGMAAPWLGVGVQVPLWLSLASGDFSVKFLAALLLLAPYRLLMNVVMPLRPVPQAA